MRLTLSSLTLLVSTLLVSVVPAAEGELVPKETPFPHLLSLEPSFLTQQPEPWGGTFDPAATRLMMTDVLHGFTTDTIAHSPATAVYLKVTNSVPLVVGLETRTPSESNEVYRRQLLQPGENTVYWLLEERVGKSANPRHFFFSFGADQVVEFSGLSAGLVQTGSVDNATVANATQFLLFQIGYKRVEYGRLINQPVQVVLPRELYRRFLGQKIVIMGGDERREILIDPKRDLKQEFFFEQQSIPLGQIGLGRKVFRAAIMDEFGEELFLLGEDSFDVVEPSADTLSFKGTFEVPFRSVRDYSVFDQAPDFRLVVLPFDQLSKPEPKGYESCAHEVLDFTISLNSGSNREHVAWRAPAYDHFAEAGFNSLSIGRSGNAVAVYLTGENAAEMDILGFLFALDQAPLGAPIQNPLHRPSDEWTGHRKGLFLDLMSSGTAPYGAGHVMLNQASTRTGEFRMIPSVSNDLRSWVDAGLVTQFNKPSADTPNPKPAEHLFLTKFGSLYYIIRNQELWVSPDPLREWSRTTVELPAWEKLRLIQLGESWYFFGLDEVESKQGIRWHQADWSPHSTGF
ncbi:MAG: hypothetical protein SFY68_07750, partial [Candidatus Sumerlaeia bacterium]|nr:hypothetical protein [Candidatus Sumerlaeia bacterium]